MKKVISVFLTLAIVVFCFPVYAISMNNSDENYVNKGTDSITLRLAYGNVFEEVNDTNSKNYSSNYVVAYKSDENPDVYELADSNEYVMNIGMNQYQLADKIELFITETSQINALNVPQEIKDTIAQDFYDSPDGYIEGSIFLPSVSRTRDNESTMDYTYNGYNMRQYLYTYNNFEASNVNVTSGIKTKERLSAAIDFLFTVMSSVGDSDVQSVIAKLNPYTAAASILIDFLKITQSDAAFASSSDDSMYITPHWNRYLKFTYCDLFHDGNYFLGLKSICAQLTEIEYDIYFKNANNGVNCDYTDSIYEYLYSPNYSAPNATAVACAATEARLEDTIQWEIYSKSENNNTLLCTIYID